MHRDRGRPQLIGSTIHLLGGAVEVEDQTWDGARLTIRLRCPGQRQGALAIVVPPGYGLTETFGPATVERRGALLLLRVAFEDEAVVGARFAGLGGESS